MSRFSGITGYTRITLKSNSVADIQAAFRQLMRQTLSSQSPHFFRICNQFTGWANPAGTWPLQFDTITADPLNLSTLQRSSPTTGVTISADGYWSFVGQLEGTAVTAGFNAQLLLYKNGSIVARGDVTAPAAGNPARCQLVSGRLACHVADVMDLEVVVVGSGTLNLVLTTDGSTNFFAGQLETRL